MEIRDFALRILWGNTLEDKLSAPEGPEGSVWTDLHPGHALLDTPPGPGRPQRLAFEDWHQRDKIAFPSACRLHIPSERALVLHFFANHELLALELMALALLRFTDAPPSFRMGIVHTMLEEQGHMRLYLARMAELGGVQFGDIPVNHFFWKCLSHMETPMDYCVGMGMVFEQANLDFALHYKELFALHEDEKSRAIMEQVLQEEIGHVRHGLNWFRKWKNPALSDWEDWKSRLKLPLSPARARGAHFASEAREQAGFCLDYVSRLQVFTQSKGRPPTVWIFNPHAENERVVGSAGGSEPPRHSRDRQADLAPLLGFLASPEDVVVVPQIPSLLHLNRLKDCGFESPEWVQWQGLSHKGVESQIVHRHLTGLSPWGWSPQSASDLAPLKGRLIHPHSQLDAALALPPNAHALWKHPSTHISSKAYGARLLRQWESSPSPRVAGDVVDSVEGLLKSAHNWWAQGWDTLLIKAPHGASGRNMQQLRDHSLSDGQLRWVQNTLAAQGEIVVEPWLNRVADFSLLFRSEKGKRVGKARITRFLTTPKGAYLGTWAGVRDRVPADWPPDMRQTLATALREWEDKSHELCEKLWAEGYEGPVGVDGFLWRDKSGTPHFKSLSEINGRWTMGFVASALAARVTPGATLFWGHLRLEELLAQYGTTKDLCTFVDAQFPLQIQHRPAPQIQSGILWTQDPLSAKSCLSVLAVGPEATMWVLTQARSQKG